MEEDRFDELTKALAGPISRRSMLKVVGAAAIGWKLPIRIFGSQGRSGVGFPPAPGPHPGPPPSGPPRHCSADGSGCTTDADCCAGHCVSSDVNRPFDRPAHVCCSTTVCDAGPPGLPLCCGAGTICCTGTYRNQPLANCCPAGGGCSPGSPNLCCINSGDTCGPGTTCCPITLAAVPPEVVTPICQGGKCCLGEGYPCDGTAQSACCSGYCKGYGALFAGTCCHASGYVNPGCQQDTCCDGCAGNTCCTSLNGTCDPNTAVCCDNGAHCSQHLSGGGNVCCTGFQYACTSDTDCCDDSCSNGICCPAGRVGCPGTPNETGYYRNGCCQPGQICGPNQQCCLPDNATGCLIGSDCCSGICTGGVCGCGPCQTSKNGQCVSCGDANMCCNADNVCVAPADCPGGCCTSGTCGCGLGSGLVCCSDSLCHECCSDSDCTAKGDCLTCSSNHTCQAASSGTLCGAKDGCQTCSSNGTCANVADGTSCGVGGTCSGGVCQQGTVTCGPCQVAQGANCVSCLTAGMCCDASKTCVAQSACPGGCCTSGVCGCGSSSGLICCSTDSTCHECCATSDCVSAKGDCYVCSTDNTCVIRAQGSLCGKGDGCQTCDNTGTCQNVTDGGICGTDGCSTCKSGVCTGCTSPQKCCGNGTCAECCSNADCTGTCQVCTANGTCGPSAKGTSCGNGMCCDGNGSCDTCTCIQDNSTDCTTATGGCCTSTSCCYAASGTCISNRALCDQVNKPGLFCYNGTCKYCMVYGEKGCQYSGDCCGADACCDPSGTCVAAGNQCSDGTYCDSTGLCEATSSATACFPQGGTCISGSLTGCCNGALCDPTTSICPCVAKGQNCGANSECCSGTCLSPNQGAVCA